MADIQKTVSIIFQGEDRVSAQLGNIEKGLGGIGTEAGQATGKVDSLGDELGKVGMNEAQVLKAVDALKALAAAIVVKEFIDSNVAYEQFIKTMTIATGSTEKAAEEFEYIRGVANRFGTEIQSTAESYAKFASAAKGTAIEGEDARRIFEAFAGSLAATGASAADVSGAMVQLSQGVSKGRFDLQDLKSIAERIPGFFLSFADSLGVTVEELYKMISAGQIGATELLQFAENTNEALESIKFDGFTASVARFRNAMDDVYRQIGSTGVFDALTGAVQGGTIAVASLLNGFIALGEIAGAVAGALVSGDWASLPGAVSKAYDSAIEKTSKTFEAVLSVEKAAKASGEAGKKAGEEIEEGMKKGELSAEQMAKASSEVDKALKALGIDPNQFKDPIEGIVNAFTALANNPAVRGDQFLAGFKATLQQIEGEDVINKVWEQLEIAFQEGRISADEYAVAIDLLNQKQLGTLPAFEKTAEKGKANAKALDDQAKAAAKAEEETRKYALELEKLASNERIALIEARVQLNIAGLEADTKRVEAAFESINVGIDSTGNLLGTLFSGYAEAVRGPGYTAQRAIEDQIRKENERRDQEFALQEKLVTTQIEEMKARTQAMQKGDALIKIQGDGLKPHLEAFMWEILRSIQVRVNADGLDLLVGA
jgi:tape measure domain-containing protein